MDFHKAAFQMMRRLCRAPTNLMLLGVVLAACANVTEQPSQAVKPKPALVVDAREIVALVSTPKQRDVILAAGQRENYRLRKITDLPALKLIMISFDMAEGVTGKEAIAALEGAEPGSTVGINHAFELQQTASGVGRLNYANALLGWPNAGCRAFGAIGVVDTGVDARAPGLAAAKVFAEKFFEGRSGSTQHGTEISSVLADPTRLKGVTIYSANVFEQSRDAGLAAGADSLVRALDWMAQSDVRIVNLALAGPYNKLLDLAVERAVERGLILVAAVGNAGPDVPPQFPAAHNSVIAVTAVDAKRQIMPNAIRGAHVDIAAPGVDVLVSTGSKRRLVTGTSIATPFVAARIAADEALLALPNGRAVERSLRRTATDLGATGMDPLFGAGLLQAKGLCASVSG